MSFNYQPNYMQLIKALQSGGIEGASQAKQARATRGLGGKLPLDIKQVDTESLSEQMLSYFSDIDEQNKRAREENKAKAEAAEKANAEVDPVTGEIEPPMEDPDVNMSGDIIDMIASFEGFRSTAYDDFGQLSIGYGTKATSKNQTMTEEEARKELTKQVMQARTIVLKAAEKHGYDWSENQIDALTSFTYNLGQGNLNQLLENGTRGNEEISEMMLEYDKADGKTLGGLTKRRKTEADLFTQGYNS